MVAVVIHVRYNIRYGRIGAADSDVEDAASAADMHSRILTFPNGKNTWSDWSDQQPEYNTIKWRDTTHFDSEDDYRTGCRNVCHCQQQQSCSGLRSSGRSNSTYFWNDSWVQTFHKRKVVALFSRPRQNSTLTWYPCNDGWEMYRRAWCTCKVVLLI